MDERQAQIREGAGLEESKLNVEFIEWLRRWSTPLMMVAAITAAGYFLYQRYERAQLQKVDRAFAELDSALSTASPESLKAVAVEYDGVRAVPVLARLGAADAYLRAARTGIKPGAAPKPDGTFAPEDLLADKDRESVLGEAEQQYQQVLAKTGSDPKEALHAIGAAFGLAAVAESRGQMDQAKQHYERVVALAEQGGYAAQGEIAKKRMADLPANAEPSRLYAKSELPTLPSPPPPPAPPGASGPTGMIGGNIPGMTFTPTFSPPTGQTGATGATAPTGAPGPTGTPAPTGSPAPTGAPSADGRAETAGGADGLAAPSAGPGANAQMSRPRGPSDSRDADPSHASDDPGAHLPDERIIVGPDLILPGGKIDPAALERMIAEARAGDEDAELPTVRFTLNRDLQKRLDKYLTDRITFMSRSQLQRLIDEGGVLVNGRRPKASTNLRKGDTVEVVVPPPPPTEIQPEEIPLEVLYEDEHLIVINKTPDIIVHPARSHLKGTMINALAWHFRNVSKSGTLSGVGAEFARPGVVHRLDRHTSGVIVFAKRDEAHWKLGHQFEHRRVDKRYLAVVHGTVEPVAEVIDLPIGPHPSREKGYREKYVVRHDELGKPSVTICRVAERYGRHARDPADRFSLVELELKTGRTHQIRVHLSYLGFPIVGDDMYGGRPYIAEGNPVMARQALHAALLAFDHPVSGQRLVFTAPLRGDMATLVKRLRLAPGFEALNPAGATVDLSRAV